MPKISEALEQAARLVESGNLDEAARVYRRVIKTDPRQAEAWHRLGLVAQARGDAAGALDCIGRALQIDSRNPNFHNNLAAVLQSQSRPVEATASFRRALELKPDSAEVHCNLAAALRETGKTAEAFEELRQAIHCNPELAEAHFQLGITHQSQHDSAGAIESYRDAIRLKPNYAEAYHNLGAIYKRLGDLAEALACYSKALEFKPNFAEALNNLGNVFQTQGRAAEALVCFEQSLRINPRYPQAHFNLAAMQLAVGNFNEGWREYEWRWLCPDFPRPSSIQPRWDGKPLEGRRLLVIAEQGLGDTLQFIRYVPMLERQAGPCAVQVQQPLVPLLTQAGFRNLVAKGESLPPHDVYAPLLSLPGVFGTTLETIPSNVPYLSADSPHVAAWRTVLGDSDHVRVGIAWQGSATHRSDRFRSIALTHFAPLALPGVELVSLQKGTGREQLAEAAHQFRVRDLGPHVDEAHGAFVDTAAIMRNLDLVVTSDSAVAHLAGALGVAVWVALPLGADWRWLLERDDSPWYPTMRLFRQSELDHWPDVFRRIAAALGQQLQGRDLRARQ